MAEYTPPTDNVPIFDVSNFITSSSGSGLTEEQIATKFLRFPTGQGTETLPELITGSITAPNTLDIVMPNASASNVLNVGIVSRNISGQIHHYSDGDNCVAGAGVHINNGINNASSTNIMNGTTTTGQVNIMSGATTTGTIAIGKYTSALSQTTTTISGATNISNTGGVVNIGTQATRTTGISIGSGNYSALSGGTVDINTGDLSAGQTSINSGYNATGAILIGSASNVTQTCYINSGQIGIGTAIPSTNTRNITIGASDSGFNSNTSLNGNTTIVGTTNINNTGTGNTRIGNAGASNFILGTTTINTSGGQPTSIGNGSSTTTIVGPTNINATGGQNTSIGTTDLGTTTINGLAINIGATNTGTNGIKIGNSAITTNVHNVYGTLGISSTTTSTGLITANGGLTMGGSNNITLGNGAVKPATSANLGFVSTTTAVNTYLTGTPSGFNRARLNATMNYFSSGITLSAGSWIITYSVQLKTDNATLNYCYLYNSYVVSGTSDTIGGTFIGAQVFTSFDATVAKAGYPCNNNNDNRPAGAGTVIVSPITTTTYNVQGYISTLTAQVGNIIIENSVLSAIRIA